MRPTPTTRGALRRWSAALFLLPLLLAASPAFAQDPVVTAADPDMAEQETYDLVVKITGNNFGVDSQVDFFVAGTTDPGGIHVKHVKRKNPKTLEATIDVAPGAAVELFDIQVRTNGRTGKGTELFRVLAKTNGPDSLPPGDVTDLAVPEAEIELGSAAVTFSASADDAGNSLSGPANRYLIKVRSGGAFTLETWETEELPGLGQMVLKANTSPWPDPGDPIRIRQPGLAPGTGYWVGVRAYDEADNASGIEQASFRTPDAPASDWLEEPIDATCASGQTNWLSVLDLDVDPGGRPAVLFSRRCPEVSPEIRLYLARREGAVWVTEELSFSSVDSSFEDLAFDPTTWEPALVHSGMKLYFYRRSGGSWIVETLERSQAGAASLAYWQGEPTIAYKRGASIRVARRNGNRWDKTDFPLPTAQNTLFGTLHLVFDGFGSPAIAYGMDRDGSPSAEIVQVAVWDGGAWRQEWVDEVDPGWMVSSVSLAWDASREDFSLAYDASASGAATTDGSRIRTCDRSGPGSWTCRTLPVEPDRRPYLETTSLVVDSLGEAHLFFTIDIEIVLAVHRAPGSDVWSQPEYVGWAFPPRAALDPSTDEPVLATTSSPPHGTSLPGGLNFLWRQP